MQAVDFLHRSGRTGRAGQLGTVISFYNKTEAPLANRVRTPGHMVVICALVPAPPVLLPSDCSTLEPFLLNCRRWCFAAFALLY
jgi:superfamily II DNA/RNA helicase